MTELAISLIDPADDNVRQKLKNLDSLAASIRSQGILEPVLVRPRGGRYQLVAGARRLAAASKAGLATVPATVKEMTDQQRRSAMLVENLQREDLTPIEEAEGYAELLQLEPKLSQRALGRQVGVSQARISKRLALLELPEPVRRAVHDGRFPVRSAEELGRLVTHGLPDRAQALAELVIAGKLRPTWKPLRGFVDDELHAAGVEKRRQAERRAARLQDLPVPEHDGRSAADAMDDTAREAWLRELAARGLQTCPGCQGKGAVPLRPDEWDG